MKQEVKTLYDEIQAIYDESLPKTVVSKLLALIPKQLGPDEDPYGKYVYLNKICTYGEYKASLLLYDKHYCSALHDYGEKEELLYSYKTVTPGIMKDYKIRNSRGMFNHTYDMQEVKKLDLNKSNIYLIKRTIWDSFKYEKKLVTYTICVYSHDSNVENQRKQQAETTLARMKDELRQASEKGSVADGSKSS